MKKKSHKEIVTRKIRAGIFHVQEIISGHYEQFRSTSFLGPHRLEFYSVFLVSTGYIRHNIDFRAYECSVGDIFFMQPQQIHLFETARDFGGYSLVFKPEMLMPSESSLPFIQNLRHTNKLSPNETQVKELTQLFQKMIREQDRPDSFSPSLIRSFFCAMLFELSRIYQDTILCTEWTEEKTRFVEKFRLLVDMHWKSVSNVSDYAKMLYVSPGYLNQLVKENTGRKATEWIQDRKLTEAKRLILHSDFAIKEIAFRTGFEDPAYFNRFFKKWNGMTPQEFREEIHKKYNSSL